MKKMLFVIAILLAANAGTFAQVTKHHQDSTMHKTAAKYTCPMHPEVVMNKPGKCPKCGMALVKMKPGKKASKMKGDMKDSKM